MERSPMPDMLVKLYDLPNESDLERRLADRGITVRRSMAAELHLTAAWAGRVFEPAWASEVTVAFARQPIANFVAVLGDEPIGFACYDTAARGFFGPTGVDPAHRGIG